VHVREAMVGHLRHIDEDLASRVAAGLALDRMPDAPVAAAPVQEMEPSPALQIIGKMKDTLMGRAVGILIADGSDGAAIKKIKKAATDAGATVKIVAPKVGGATLADGSMLAADGQLAGTPSVLFDAVAVILSEEGAKALSRDSAAIDFVARCVRASQGNRRRQRGPGALENSECRTRRGRRGYQRHRRVYCRGKDTPMGPRKVRSNTGLTAGSLGLATTQRRSRGRCWQRLEGIQSSREERRCV